jgi:hypothetical protein
MKILGNGEEEKGQAHEIIKYTVREVTVIFLTNNIVSKSECDGVILGTSFVSRSG